MSENSKIEAQSPIGTTAGDGGIDRRRLIRAGLAAAPVMLGLKSRSALATGGTHISCSVWASLSAAKGCRSSHTQQHVGNTCKHYTYWQDSTNYHCGKRYHNYTTFTAKFDDNCFKDTATVRDVCRGSFSDGSTIIRPYTTVDSKKFEFAKHCSAMHINASNDSTCPVNTDHIKAIWSACKEGGYCAPPITGAAGWSRDEWCNYFNYLCKGATPASWGTTCA